MKKTIALLLAFSLLATTGCAGSPASSSTPETSCTASNASSQAGEQAEEPSLEEQLDAFWNEELDTRLKEEAGYPNGSEGMGAVVLAIKDGQTVFEKAYGYAHYYDADYQVEGSTYANPVYVKTENPREMTTDIEWWTRSTGRAAVMTAPAMRRHSRISPVGETTR